jgi:hypothetical protein
MAATLGMGAATDTLTDEALLAVIRQVLAYRTEDTFASASERGRERLASLGVDVSKHFSEADQRAIFSLLREHK